MTGSKKTKESSILRGAPVCEIRGVFFRVIRLKWLEVVDDFGKLESVNK